MTLRGRPFQPGQSGNPAGRPVGSRNKLCEGFIDALSRDFAQHGAGVIAKVREEHPSAYLRLVASLVAAKTETPTQTGGADVSETVERLLEDIEARIRATYDAPA